MAENHYLWVEKYRPSKLDDYVWRDAEQRAQVEKWIKDGQTPTLMFAGIQGSGKTSLARLILKELKVNKGDILEINASRERSLDTLRDKIMNFMSTWPIGDCKYILMDEIDGWGEIQQRALRNDIEQYSDTCRFIFTCNEPRRIIPALHSRCQKFEFQALDMEAYFARCMTILDQENVKYEPETVVAFIDATYPDMRKCVNLLQQHSVDGQLIPLKSEDTNATQDYLLEMVNLFNQGKYTEARKLVIESAVPDQYESIYRFFYENLHFWGDTEEQQNAAIVAIKDGLVNHGRIADVEINLAATIVALMEIRRGA